MKDLLNKEKLLSDKVKNLRKELLEKEAALYKFDEYESLQKYVERLNKEIKEIKNKPICFGSASTDEYFCIPSTLTELKLFKIKDEKVENKIPIIPEINTNLRPIISNIIASKEVKDFMISIREKLIEKSLEQLNKIEADIDIELE